MAAKEGDERREYFRLDDILPIDYRPLSSECSDEGEDQSIEDILSKEGVSPCLARLLKSIDDKLNLIISSLEREGVIAHIPQTREVNISAGGVRFNSDQKFNSGDDLRITLGLPPYPYTMLSMTGKVVRSEKCGDGDKIYYDTAVEFVDVDDDAKNDIMRYLFDLQRKSIGKGKENKP